MTLNQHLMRIPIAAPRTPCLAFRRFQEKRFAKPSFRVFWTAD